MRLVSAEEIDAAVLHLVAPHEGRGMVLSEAVLDTTSRDEVTEFLLAHINNGIQDVQSRAADFIVSGQDKPAGLSQRLLEDGSQQEFVDHSQSLARQLHGVVSADRRISDGTLAIVRFDGKRKGTEILYLALLKLDPSEQFRTIATEDDQGRRVVTLDVESDILPSAGERLQKSAFIREPSDDDDSRDGPSDSPDYRILLLDRQTSGTPARFFVESFLGAEFVLDDTERTQRLYKTLRRTRNHLEEELDAEELRSLDQSIRSVFTDRMVDLDVFTEALSVGDHHREVIDTALREQLPDREFSIDRSQAARFVSKMSFKGDHGLRVTVNADAFDDMIDIDDIEGTSPPVREITIRTREWTEA